MRSKSSIITAITLVVALVILTVGLAPTTSRAAGHREAPLIALDPEADITDYYMFRSYETGKSDKVVLVMDVIPLEEPSAAPNYFNFDPNVLYAFNVDNNADGIAEDIIFEVRFETEFRGVCKALGLPLSFAANIPPSTGAIVPPITKLDGAGSEGLCMRQNYSVTMVKGGKRTTLGSGLFAVPSNVGPRTMPNYDALAAQGIYNIGSGVRVFAGQRDDPFYIDLGAIFDTLNLKSPGVDMVSGFNVNTIALEVPATLLTVDGRGADNPQHTTIGSYGSTSRRKVRVLGEGTSGPWVQVQRMANPLVNELVIGTADKDRWNSLDPEQENAFLNYYRNPPIATAFNLVFGAPVPATPREDLVNILLKYGGGNPSISELLRLNMSIKPTPLAQQNRLGGLAGDNGYPNGRRPNDDVVDITIQVVGGAAFAGAGDNVNGNDKPFPDKFPFLSSPHDGVTRQHKNR